MRPPDKGSFTPDHFQECVHIVHAYNQCLAKHQLMPKRCRNEQINYMKCRMEKGLMKEEDFQKLGFVEQTSWQNEVQEKEFLFKRMEEQKAKAKLKAEEAVRLQRQKMQSQPAPPSPGQASSPPS